MFSGIPVDVLVPTYYLMNILKGIKDEICSALVSSFILPRLGLQFFILGKLLGLLSVKLLTFSYQNHLWNLKYAQALPKN